MGKKTLWVIGIAAAAAAIGGASAAAAIGGASAAAAAIGGASAAVAASTVGEDQPLTGTTLQQASDAAIAHTGPGTVTSAETDDDASYEVNVQLENGSRVEVELNSSFQVVSTESGDQDND
ncbi:hypothetical protein M1D88_07545 [Arthrobacter sp. R1-13]